MLVVAAQDLAPKTPSPPVVLGLTIGVASVLHVGLGKLQEAIGLVKE